MSKLTKYKGLKKKFMDPRFLQDLLSMMTPGKSYFVNIVAYKDTDGSLYITQQTCTEQQDMPIELPNGESEWSMPKVIVEVPDLDNVALVQLDTDDLS